MIFLKDNRRFSFLYGGKKIDDCSCGISAFEDGDTLTTVYRLEGGLQVTNVAKKYEKYGAYEWVNYFENTSDEPTEIISELFDADFSLPFEHEDSRKTSAYFPSAEEATKVYAPSGSTVATDEFCCDVDKIVENSRINHIYPGVSKRYATSGGRSSNTRAPFFNVTKNGKGVIFAIGWTGQWNCEIVRGEDDIAVRTKIEDTSFRLLGGEKIRTSSIVVMPYECSVTASQNKWRRLVKEHFSLVGKRGRLSEAPLSASLWGGMRTETALDRIEKIRASGLPFDHVWMDAGWYGEDTEPTPDEFEGDWPQHTGDWVVAKKIHPDGLCKVSEAIHDGGMKFILWFEPERVIKGTPITKSHPEYFLYREGNGNLMLNLGNEEAWKYCFETLSGIIEKLHIDFYRQDFNFEPLTWWRLADKKDRKGISEIKHINGLYRLWDALLDRFPHLMIDNCASGGRRIDIETLRRSVPLWRSDYMCPANFDTYAVQCHNMTFNLWMPYSGTGTGRICDLYHIRSAYSASLGTNYAYSERDAFGDDPEKIRLIRHFTEEYLKLRPFYSEDFYPLTQFSDKEDVWCAMQFDRPEKNDGIVQIFRRDKSPYNSAVLRLGNIRGNSAYTFTDIDDGSSFVRTGKELAERGFEIEIAHEHTAKIFMYSVK